MSENSVGQTIAVPPLTQSCRIDAWLTTHLSALSRSQLQKIIREGRVRVDGQPVKPRHILHGGESVQIEASVPTSREERDTANRPQPQNIPLDLLHEDDDLLVINKPAGLVIHPGAGTPDGTLVNALLHRYPEMAQFGNHQRPGIVHRLDRATTGCLVVARNDNALRALAAQLEDHSMHRLYIAWALGHLPETSGRIEAPIGRSMRNRTRMAIVRNGRAAATRWHVHAFAPGLSRLLCRLETGRTHQIRVHLAHIGHAVAGDPDYGPDAREARMRIPPGHPAIVQAVSHAKRQMLHAWRVRFRHPRTGEYMQFEAPLSEDLADFDAHVLPEAEHRDDAAIDEIEAP